MKKINQLLFIFFILSSISFAKSESTTTNQWVAQQMQTLQSHVHHLDAKVLRLSLIAYTKARAQGLDQKQILTVIDYTKPSTEKRLWIFDLRTDKTLYNTWVSHGKNSGDVNTTSFSNQVGSLKSSLGVFITDEPYFGKVGYGLRISGLEHGFNDNAYRRATVVHGARYVSASAIRAYGRIGRTWGCLAVNKQLARPIINTIRNNTVIFAYYPDHHWLAHSKYLMA